MARRKHQRTERKQIRPQEAELARFWPSEPEFVAMLLLALLTIATFWPVLSCGFVSFDDPDYVTGNSHVQQGLSWPNVAWAFTTADACNYWHPLTWLSLMLDYQLFELNPRGYHAVNLALHVGCVVLVFLIFHRSTRRLGRSSLVRSAAVAALFAVHPLRVESVAWVAERKDVLSAFLGLAAIAAYVGWVHAPTRPRYGLVLALYALSLMAKPMFVTLPFLLLLLDYWPLERQRSAADPGRAWQKILYDKIPLFALALASSLATYLVQVHTVQTMGSVPATTRASNALVSYVRYLDKMLCFDELAMMYPYPANWPTWQVVACVVFLLASIALVLWRLRPNPWLAVGWFWYLGMLVPMLGLVQVGLQSMADRFTYVPSLGLLLMAVWSLPERWLTSRGGRVGLGLATAAALVTLSAFTWRQCKVWRNGETLFTHTLDVTENNYAIEDALGALLVNEGRVPEALEHFQKAVEIKPDYPLPHLARGTIYQDDADHRDLKAALEEFSQAVKFSPLKPAGYYRRAMLWATAPDDAQIRNGKQSLEDARQACALTDWKNPHMLIALIAAYAELGDFDEALRWQQEAVRLGRDDPGFARYAMLIGLKLRRHEPLRLPTKQELQNRKR